jgi:hypothetical protein
MAADYSGFKHFKTDGLVESECPDCHGEKTFVACVNGEDQIVFCQYCEGVSTVYAEFPDIAKPQHGHYPRSGSDPRKT